MSAGPSVSSQGPSREHSHADKAYYHPSNQNAKIGPEVIFGPK